MLYIPYYLHGENLTDGTDWGSGSGLLQKADAFLFQDVTNLTFSASQTGERKRMEKETLFSWKRVGFSSVPTAAGRKHHMGHFLTKLHATSDC